MPVDFAELCNDVEQIRVLNKSVPGASSSAKTQKELDVFFVSWNNKLLSEDRGELAWKQNVFLFFLTFDLDISWKLILLERDNC